MIHLARCPGVVWEWLERSQSREVIWKLMEGKVAQSDLGSDKSYIFRVCSGNGGRSYRAKEANGNIHYVEEDQGPVPRQWWVRMAQKADEQGFEVSFPFGER